MAKNHHHFAFNVKEWVYYLGFSHFHIWISLNLAKFIMDDCHLSNITIFIFIFLNHGAWGWYLKHVI
jgi:hypothetical protein